MGLLNSIFDAAMDAMESNANSVGRTLNEHEKKAKRQGVELGGKFYDVQNQVENRLNAIEVMRTVKENYVSRKSGGDYRNQYFEEECCGNNYGGSDEGYLNSDAEPCHPTTKIRESISDSQKIEREEKGASSNEEIGGKTIEELRHEWINLGVWNEINAIEIPKEMGIIRFVKGKDVCYVLRAIEPGGIRKVIGKLKNGENKKSLIYKKLKEAGTENVYIEILIVEDREDRINICRNLERIFIEQNQPIWM